MNDLQNNFDIELNRLLALSLSPEEETLARRYYSQDERDSMDESDFCGPDQTYPVKTQSDISNAASLAGHADNPDEVRACIKRKAKANGWTLPASWEDDSKERAMKAPDNHDPFTGSHSHAHPAFGSQGDDETHTHSHTHDNDAEHGHSHADDDKPDPPQDRSTPATIQTSDRPTMYAPFLRIDAAKREVVGQATAEVPDSYGTIFGYYPPAWEKWRGNIREQHDPKKAVGSKVDYFPNEELRLVDLHSRVSRGAQDTWLKVEDNVLTGYSLSVIPDAEFGNDVKKWPRKEYQGKDYPYLPRYSIAEVSLVDNPACPGCDIAIVRADGVATDVLDLEDDPVVAVEPKQEQRAGARIGSATKDAMHKSIAHTLHAATAQMSNCGCPTCVASQKAIDPDGDGDIDLGGYDDPDGDSDAAFSSSGSMPDDVVRAITNMIERSLQPAYARLQGIAGTLSRNSSFPSNIESLVTSSITRAFEVIDAKLADLPSKTSLDEVRTSLEMVKGQVVKIAEQPMPGGPVLNANAVEKRLATDPPRQTAEQQQQSYGAVYEAIRNLSLQGGLDTPDKQVEAMAAGLAAQRGRR